MISIPSVRLSIWQVKIHVCFYCARSEQLSRGVVRTLTASWLCTMAANAGASENRIVPNKNSKSPVVWTYFGFPCDVDGAVNNHKVVCRLCNLELPYSHNTTNLFAHLQTHHKAQYIALKGTSTATRLYPLNILQ